MANLEDIERAVKEIKAGKPAPVYLLYGDQDYLVKQAYDRILEALVPEELQAFNLEQHDGGRVEVGQLLDGLMQVPMLAGAKAVGVPECRFLLSKGSAGDLLLKARTAWESKDPNTALRQLGRVLVLAATDWAAAQGLDLDGLAAALGADLEASKLGGEWLGQALAQGLASDFPLPRSADDGQALLDGLEAGLPAGVHLVLAAPSADGRKKLFKWIQDKGKVLDFKTSEQGGAQAQSAAVFLRTLLTQQGLSMDIAVANRCVAAYGHDLGLLAKEIEKLAAHAHPRSKLGEADLAAVGSPRPEEGVFDLLRALGEQKAGEAFRLLRQLLEQEPPERLFAMVSGEVRMLYLGRCMIEEGLLSPKGPGEYPSYRAGLHPKLVKDLPPALAEAFKKKHPFVTYQALKRCSQFNLGQLRQALRFLHDAERQMKSGGRGVTSLLEELILLVCGIKEEALL